MVDDQPADAVTDPRISTCDADRDPVNRLRAFLAANGSDAEIVEPSADTATVAAAAAALGVGTSQIIKSLLFRTRERDSLLVIALGGYRVNRERLSQASHLGRLKLASADEVASLTGFVVGGMPPVGHSSDLNVIVDQEVLRQPIVFGGGGRSDLLLQIRPEEIVRLANATVASVCDPEL